VQPPPTHIPTSSDHRSSSIQRQALRRAKNKLVRLCCMHPSSPPADTHNPTSGEHRCEFSGVTNLRQGTRGRTPTSWSSRGSKSIPYLSQYLRQVKGGVGFSVECWGEGGVRGHHSKPCNVLWSHVTPHFGICAHPTPGLCLLTLPPSPVQLL
jgi:hypothetical protein